MRLFGGRMGAPGTAPLPGWGKSHVMTNRISQIANSEGPAAVVGENGTDTFEEVLGGELVIGHA